MQERGHRNLNGIPILHIRRIGNLTVRPQSGGILMSARTRSPFIGVIVLAMPNGTTVGIFSTIPIRKSWSAGTGITSGHRMNALIRPRSFIEGQVRRARRRRNSDETRVPPLHVTRVFDSVVSTTPGRRRRSKTSHLPARTTGTQSVPTASCQTGTVGGRLSCGISIAKCCATPAGHRRSNTIVR